MFYKFLFLDKRTVHSEYSFILSTMNLFSPFSFNELYEAKVRFKILKGRW